MQQGPGDSLWGGTLGVNLALSPPASMSLHFCSLPGSLPHFSPQSDLPAPVQSLKVWGLTLTSQSAAGEPLLLWSKSL